MNKSVFLKEQSVIFKKTRIQTFVIALLCIVATASCMAQTIEPLTVKGDAFINAKGQSVRFWGTNLVALYPSKQQAQKIAEDLADHQINLARPHHMMRPSRDWVWGSKIFTLNDYEAGNTRKPNADAWDRFDYLNSQLRDKGIYLMLAGRWSRTYLPYDVDVLKTTEEDEAAWIMAMDEFNKRHWKKNMDARKLLPLVDERCAALDAEFIKQTLTHVNPYTKLAYGNDPQVLTYELTNEYSSDYVLICGNDLTPYFQKKLIAKWENYAKNAGLSEPGDLYKAQTDEQKRVRAAFFRDLDEQYLIKTKAMMRSLGFKGAITFSNLWRGESALQMHEQHADYIEDHAYVNPRVADSREDFLYSKSKTILADKPYILGEFNESEGGRVKTEGPYRSQLLLAAAAYGVHQGIDGIVWFAWCHGDRDLTAEGTAKKPGREPHIGTMIADEMMRDHLRTTGMIFRNQLVDPASEKIIFTVGKPHTGTDYNALMRPNMAFKPGWQSVHAFGKSFDEPASTLLTKSWMRSEPSSPIISDTKQIIKDLDAKQLRIIAPKTEAFSGDLNGSNWSSDYQHLTLGNHQGFATVVLVTMDNQPLKQAKQWLISRTTLDAQGNETDTLPVTLSKLPTASATLHTTRPTEQTIQLQADSQGHIQLPDILWHEAVVSFK
jgi:hypothetical protein